MIVGVPLKTTMYVSTNETLMYASVLIYACVLIYVLVPIFIPVPTITSSEITPFAVGSRRQLLRRGIAIAGNHMIEGTAVE